MEKDRDKTDQDFDIWWAERGRSMCEKLTYNAFLGGSQSALAIASAIIKGDDDAPADT